MASFDEVLKDCTKLGTKIPTSEYLESGKYPIIDQGQNDIAGYYDSDDGLFEDVPTIVFGDHTRVVKYVDKPCFLGADGVKLLCPLDKDINCKYLFYQLSCADIPNTGYNRHFKWVKALDFKIPSSDEQNHVVEVLDKVTELISLRKQQLFKLDELVKARFVEMFGDLVVGDKIQTSKKKIGEIASVTKLAGFEFTKYIQYKEHGDIIMLRGLNCKQGKLILDDVKWIDRKTSDLLPRSKLYYGDILMTYAGTIGDVAMVDENDKYHLAPNVAKVSINNKKAYNPIFLMYLFLYSNDYIMRFASQVAQASINMEKIRNFEYYFPDVTFQNQFATFVERVDKQKQTVQQSLEKLELMKKALMQEYFGQLPQSPDGDSPLREGALTWPQGKSLPP